MIFLYYNKTMYFIFRINENNSDTEKITHVLGVHGNLIQSLALQCVYPPK